MRFLFGVTSLPVRGEGDPSDPSASWVGLLGGGGSVEVSCFLPKTVRQCLLSAAREFHPFKSAGKLLCT